MPDDASPLHDHDLLCAILDLLIPPRADGRLPGAGALGLAPQVGADLAADPRFGPVVEAGLAAVRDAAAAQHPGGFTALEPDERLALFEELLPAHPALVPGLTYQLYLAYYQHPTVLAGLDEPARPPFPEGYEIEQTDPELLALLESRRQAAPDG